MFAGPESPNDVWVHLWRIIWILNCTGARIKIVVVVVKDKKGFISWSLLSFYTATVHLKCFYRTMEVSSWKKRSKYVKMFEREKLMTNLSLTSLSVANKFDIVVWKSNEYIWLNYMWLTLHVLSLIKHLFAVESKICPLLGKLFWIALLLLIFYQYNFNLFQSKPLCSICFQCVVYFCWVQLSIHSMFIQIPLCRKVWE